MELDKIKMQYKLGNKIREMIKEAGYKNFDDFAEDYGCCTKTVSRMVNNGINNLFQLIDICLFFQKDYKEVLKEIEEETKG